MHRIIRTKLLRFIIFVLYKRKKYTISALRNDLFLNNFEDQRAEALLVRCLAILCRLGLITITEAQLIILDEGRADKYSDQIWFPNNEIASRSREIAEKQYALENKIRTQRLSELQGPRSIIDAVKETTNNVSNEGGRNGAGPPNQIRDDLPVEVAIFYTTIRELKTHTGKTSADYESNGIASHVEHGKAVISFPRPRNVGDFPRPLIGIENPALHVTVISAHRISNRELIKQLKISTDGDVAIFVHGAMTTHYAALMRAAQIKLDTGFKGDMIAFSWPSLGCLGYWSDYSVLYESCEHLTKLLASIRRCIGDRRIHVIGHSLGSYVVARSVEKLRNMKVNEIVLAAPDISCLNWSTLADSFTKKTQRTTVYVSKNDSALRFSSVAARFIGRVGSDPVNAYHPDIEVVDASKVASSDFFGHQYLFKAKLAKDVGSTLSGEPQLRIQLERVVALRVGTYYRFKGAPLRKNVIRKIPLQPEC